MFIPFHGGYDSDKIKLKPFGEKKKKLIILQFFFRLLILNLHDRINSENKQLGLKW